jgi:hypothetical protein
MDCNNLHNSYILRILFVLCFWGDGDWLGARDETFHLLWGGVLNISRRLSGEGGKFYGSILKYPPPPPVHILYDRSLNSNKATGLGGIPGPVCITKVVYRASETQERQMHIILHGRIWFGHKTYERCDQILKTENPVLLFVEEHSLRKNACTTLIRF